jgi:two-component system invasion response regulator UvrY
MQLLLADDHTLVRRGLKQILQDGFPHARFLEAGNAEDVLRLVASNRCSLLLLDINLPGRSGLDVMRDVRQIAPRIPVLIVTMQSEDQYAVRCLRAGASGFVTKDSSPEELVAASRKVMGGGRYVSPRVAEMLAAEVCRPTRGVPRSGLSEREYEVLRMIADGTSLTEIASRLRLSVKTVSSHRSRILAKLGFESNAQLVRYALEQKLIS